MFILLKKKQDEPSQRSSNPSKQESLDHG